MAIPAYYFIFLFILRVVFSGLTRDLVVFKDEYEGIKNIIQIIDEKTDKLNSDVRAILESRAGEIESVDRYRKITGFLLALVEVVLPLSFSAVFAWATFRSMVTAITQIVCKI